MVITLTQLQSALEHLPKDASHATIDRIFTPPLVRGLGFLQGESAPDYKTGSRLRADHALRKTQDGDIFLETERNPFLIIELKARNISLSEGTKTHLDTVKQLKEYLLDERCCQSAKWGLIYNGHQIQLFRKYGKVMHPATPSIGLNLDNVDDVITGIRKKIEAPQQALTVAIYNNKGGVGKTTTTINLASILKLMGKKVLVIDFDPNQQDLTSALGLNISSGSFYQALLDRKYDIHNAIIPYSLSARGREYQCFDVIPADEKLTERGDTIKQNLRFSRLQEVLFPLTYEYDYILIDAPPNWRFFSQSSVYAADVVLVPTKHNNLFSLENAAVAMTKFIPQIQNARQSRNKKVRQLDFSLDYGPVVLPIFWNGEKIAESQRKSAYAAIDNILQQAKQNDGFDLKPYFYPKATKAIENKDIFELPSYAHIANATFLRMPAAYQNRTARSYYANLAKEYFLQ